jgi:hypothetical protein
MSGPLPATGDHRLGPFAVLPDGQSRRHWASTTACWASRACPSADIDIGQGRLFFRALTWAHSDRRCRGFAEPARLATLVAPSDLSRARSQMAEAMGINTFRYKVSDLPDRRIAGFASAAGWLLAHFQRTVNPSAFGLKMGIEYLFMAVIGGVGYVWGAIVGAGLVKLLDDYLQVALPGPDRHQWQLRGHRAGHCDGVAAQVHARRAVVGRGALDSPLRHARSTGRTPETCPVAASRPEVSRC